MQRIILGAALVILCSIAFDACMPELCSTPNPDAGTQTVTACDE